MIEVGMELSKRLQGVVDMVTPGCKLADIGCDHAYISIYLIKKKIATKVIAMDVNLGPLKIAKKNIAESGYGHKIEVRQSDGLKNLAKEEVETIVIAGMGGALICQILKEGMEQVMAAKELILQAQSDLPLVRKLLQDIKYQILEEKMLIDDKKYYLVIKARNAKNEFIKDNGLKNEVDKEVYLRYGRYLLEKQDLVLYQYLKWRKKVTSQIIDRLIKEKTANTKKRLRQMNKELELIEMGLDHYR